MLFKVNKALLFTATASIIWGATAPIMKLTLQEIPLFSLAFIRMATASAILGFFVYKKLKIRKVDQFNLILAALTGVTINLTLFFLGLKLTSAIVASFLTASVPIFTLIAAHLYLKEKFTKKLVLASIVAFTGVAILVGKLSASAFYNLLGVS